MESLKVASQLILQLLSNRSPELGARLKQQLNAELVRRGLSPFNEKVYGHKKFADFVRSTLSDSVSIERPEGAGDIQISLRHIAVSQLPLGGGVEPSGAIQSPIIRSDVWQAFTNPDPKRKRYFQKRTRAIRHFVTGEPSVTQEEIERNSEQFVEIEFISGQIQLNWMHSFLDSLRLPLEQRSSLDALIEKDYSSTLNSTFTRALGCNGDSWRRYRTNNVVGVVGDWCQRHGVHFDDLCVQKILMDVSPIQGSHAERPLTSRQQAVKLLELLTEDDIARFVIPSLLSSLLIKSRL